METEYIERILDAILHRKCEGMTGSEYMALLREEDRAGDYYDRIKGGRRKLEAVLEKRIKRGEE